MDLLNRLAEEKITEAINKGALENLPLQGQPLQLEDLSMVPESLRAGYILLKSNGFLPPVLALKKEIQSVEALLSRTECTDRRDEYARKLRMMRLHLGVLNQNLVDIEERYQSKLVSKLDRP